MQLFFSLFILYCHMSERGIDHRLVGNANEEASTEHGDFQQALNELRVLLGEEKQKNFDIGYATVAIHDVGDMVNVTIQRKEDDVERRVVFRVWPDTMKVAGVQTSIDMSQGYPKKRGSDIIPIFSLDSIIEEIRKVM
jgi:hypothetical protein